MTAAGALMDRIYARQRFIYDATRKFYLLGRDEMIAGLEPPPEACVLEIACGTARNLVAVARRYPTVRCYGIDISAAMLSTARRSVVRSGLGDRIVVAQADAAAFDPAALFGIAEFDRVMISYALSMIPPWRLVLRRASEVVAPEGSLHIVDFGDQVAMPPGFKPLLDAWLARFHVTPRVGLEEEVAAVAREGGLKARTRSAFRGYAFVADLTRGCASAS